MTFNPSVPLTSQSPSLFPAQNQTNMTRLKTIVAADHQFNDTAASNDGFHNVVHLTQQAPSGTDSVGRMYVKQSAGRMQLFYMDDTPVTSLNYQITPTMPIRAAVNFNGTGALGAQVIRSQFNVTSVTRTGTGVYTIAFTTPMPGADPNADYIVQVTGMGTTANVPDIVIGAVVGNPTYVNSVSVNFVKVYFVTEAGAQMNVIMGNVTIFSVT